MNATLSTPYKIYFKVVYTCKTATYLFNPAITIRTFIVLAIRKARADFAINPNDNVEIVETGQCDNINGRDAEQAPALEPSYETLEERFGSSHILPSFYIRIIPIH
jgi:hypothetical protein